VASDRGFRIIQVLTRQDPVQEMDRVQALLRYNVGGLILIPSMQPERTLKLLAESGTPSVIVDRPTKTGLLDEVTFDNRGAMFEAARRLIALGHRKIALIVRQPKLATTMLRIEGLRAAAAEAPGQVSTQIIVCDRDEVVLTGLLAAEFQKSDPPTAFVAASSVIAGWLLRALRSLGVRYPTDVSVLAFDEPEWADLVTPQLSVVRQPTLEIARSAWKLLIRRMGEESAPVRKIELKADIVLRESVGPLLPRHARAAEPSPKRVGRKERV
jgi:LacI family transcriptional regulator